MPLIDWSERLALGVERFDREHKEMAQLINQLERLFLRHGGTEDAARILARLEGKTIQHFAHEEADMLRLSFVGLAAHKADHQRRISQIRDYRHRIETGQMELSKGLLNALKAWLTNHIQIYDTRCAEVFRERP